jgi:protoheme IX farnesyltransferase
VSFTSHRTERGQITLAPARPSRLTRAGDFVALMKPRVMSLVVFAAFTGLMLAPGHLNPFTSLVTLFSIAMGAGAAGMLNMWYEADLDALMARTAMRPLPRGKVSNEEAFVCGCALAGAAILILGCITNLAAAALLALTIFHYVFVYTIWLKRKTPQNIVIGGAAGALPPVVAWVAASGTLAAEPLVLFVIIFLWTPPHFWALALTRSSEYARAGIPMLPVVVGPQATKRQIVIYSILLAAASLLPNALGFAGGLYAVFATVLSGTFVFYAVQLLRGQGGAPKGARRLFAFSILYLFALFSGLLLDAAIVSA